MQISIVGSGYVGLVSGVCLALKGHNVTCIDKDTRIVESLNKGKPHIFEEGLHEALKKVVNNGRFKAVINFNNALENTGCVIIAVGTPSTDGKIDLAQVKSAATEIGTIIKKSNKKISVIVKSTVIPGTTDNYVKKIIEETSGKKLGQFGLGMNPEFLREGNAMEDFLYPDRIVMGFEDEYAKKTLEEIYLPWECDKVYVNTRTAEMIKYSNNVFLASLISLSNELANHASKLGNIDFLNVINAVALDKRWNPITKDNKRCNPGILSYLIPGAGFGGSCFPKDVQAIRTQGESLDQQMSVLNAILSVNERQPYQVKSILEKEFDDLKTKRILLLGLAFKPGTDDIRESSAVKILLSLKDGVGQIISSDPYAIENTMSIKELSNAVFVKDWENFIDQSDIIIIGTNWTEYKILKDLDNNSKIKDKTIFDTKRLFSKGDFNNNKYLTIGFN